MCSLCRLQVAKKHIFLAIFDIWGLLYRPFTDEGQIWRATADPRIRLPVKFRLDRFILSSCGGEKPPIFAVFGLRHLVVSPVGINLRKLSTSAQPQTFPYPTASKLILHSNAFMAKSGEQSLTFKSVTNKQTSRQTDRQTDSQKKTQRFWPPRRRVKSEPHQTWHGDRGPRARSFTSKMFDGVKQSFAARGR